MLTEGTREKKLSPNSSGAKILSDGETPSPQDTLIGTKRTYKQSGQKTS